MRFVTRCLHHPCLLSAPCASTHPPPYIGESLCPLPRHPGAGLPTVIRHRPLPSTNAGAATGPRSAVNIPQLLGSVSRKGGPVADRRKDMHCIRLSTTYFFTALCHRQLLDEKARVSRRTQPRKSNAVTTMVEIRIGIVRGRLFSCASSPYEGRGRYADWKWTFVILLPLERGCV